MLRFLRDLMYGVIAIGVTIPALRRPLPAVDIDYVDPTEAASFFNLMQTQWRDPLALQRAARAILDPYHLADGPDGKPDWWDDPSAFCVKMRALPTPHARALAQYAGWNYTHRCARCTHIEHPLDEGGWQCPSCGLES